VWQGGGVDPAAQKWTRTAVPARGLDPIVALEKQRLNLFGNLI
jgi:hypothetical protein